jgi:hypothetical protein
MNLFFRFVFILLISFALYSCKKHENNNEDLPDNHVVTGFIKDYKTNLPIPNAQVYVLENSMGNNNYKEISTTVSGADGKYAINTGNLTPSLNGSQFRIRYMHESYLDIVDATIVKTTDTYPNIITLGNLPLVVKDVVLKPNAHVKIKVKNVNPFDTNDNLFLEYSHSTIGASIFLNGENVDTVINYVCPPPTIERPNVYLRYKIFKNNNWSDNLFMNKPLVIGDTVNMVLEY